MKKSLIALAVTGAMVAPMVAQADATLYGSFRIGVVDSSNNGNATYATTDDRTDGDLDVADLSSRVGIKGDVDLGLENTKGLFHWEFNVSTADSNAYNSGLLGHRLGYIGAKGDWGQALIGRQYHPHYLLISAPTNIFNPGSGGYGERFNLGNDFHKRSDNTIAYYTPNMGGFQVIAGFVLDGEGDDNDNDLDKSVDGYNIAATYAANGLTVSGSFGHVEDQARTVTSLGGVDLTDSGLANLALTDVEKEVWGLAVKYKIDALELMAKYEDAETSATGVDFDEDVWELAARYTVGATSFYGRFADYEASLNGADGDLSQFGLGVQRKLGKGKVYLEHVNNDSDDFYGDRTVAGYHVDF